MVNDRSSSVRQLRILVHAPLGVGGVTNLMLNIQKHLDREKLNFDYLVFHDRTEPQEHKALELGGRKLVASADEIAFKPLRAIVRLKRVRDVCKRNNVKIFHFNGGAPMGFLTMLAARAGGVKWITFHSHNGGMSNEGWMAKVVSALCRPLLSFVVDDYWACSELAAAFSFPKRIVKDKKYYFMPNAIDLEMFKYSPEVRNQVRKELGVTDRFVVGHAGRFNHQKNHTFLIDIFAAIYQKNPEAFLLLFGVGELQESIKKKVEHLGLQDSVLFYGASDQMERMYQAMDVFLMPSKFEGLPVAGVEAQAAGLPIVFSDTITHKVAVSPDTIFLSLQESAAVWAEKILQFKNMLRRDCCAELKNAGFEQQDMIQYFQEYYLGIREKFQGDSDNG